MNARIESTEQAGVASRAGAWVRYAGVGLAATVVLAALIGAAVGPAAVGAVWVAAAVAWGLQQAAFWLLLLVRDAPGLFVAGWAAGMLLRFGVLAIAAFWVMRTEIFPPAPLLLSLVGFMFALLLLEPVFLRRGMRTA